MALLNTGSFREGLAAVVSDTKIKLDVVVAFLTSSGLAFVLDLLWSEGPSGNPPKDEDLVHDVNLVGVPYDSLTSPEGEKRFCELDAVAWLIQQLWVHHRRFYGLQSIPTK